MIKRSKYIIVLIALGSIIFGQLKSDIPQNNDLFKALPGSDNAVSSLFDPSRFSMNNSFSMSMTSMNNQSIGVASYTNNMNFALRDNLYLQTYLTFMQPTILSANSPNPYSNTQLYFGTVLNYKPTDNTQFQISLSNYPSYARYYSSPFLLIRGY